MSIGFKLRDRVVNREHQELLDEAISYCEYSDFIKGCNHFLQEKGYLTDKQVSVLRNLMKWAERDDDIGDYDYGLGYGWWK
jgi:hypothetical protein